MGTDRALVPQGIVGHQPSGCEGRGLLRVHSTVGSLLLLLWLLMLMLMLMLLLLLLLLVLLLLLAATR